MTQSRFHSRWTERVEAPWVMDRDVLRSSLQHVIFIGHFNKIMLCFLSSVEPDTLYKESTEKTVDNEASKPNEEEPMDEN